MRLSIEQELGVDLCTDRSVRIAAVTGPAGTGKTTILKYAYNTAKTDRLNAGLCAPTGKAARRITEATGIKSSTIHKLLAFPMPEDRGKKYLDANGKVIPSGRPGLPRFNSRNPLPEDVILVDEASMIGPTLWKQLTSALKPGAIIRFFGDTNQLPPIEEGFSPFRSLLNNGECVYLTHNYRSTHDIVGNALRILGSRIPVENDHFQIIYTSDVYGETTKFLHGKSLYGTDSCQVLTPQRRHGALTTTKLNRVLQLMFNRSKMKIEIDQLDDQPSIIVRVNDKIIWVKNDYDIGLLNGDIGRIMDLDVDEGNLELDIDGKDYHIPAMAEGSGQWGKYRYDPRKQLELGYAITTHKAQGSEFDEIVYAISGHQPFLLNRNNLYTAITRARTRVTIITDRAGMGQSIKRVI